MSNTQNQSPTKLQQADPPDLLQATFCRIRQLARNKDDDASRQLIWAIADAAHNLPLTLGNSENAGKYPVDRDIHELQALLQQGT